MKKNLKQIQDKIIPLLKANGVLKASIFGSYVTGKNTKKSDVDILVELNSDFGLFEFSGLKIALEEKLRKQVDLVEYGAIRPELKQSILKNQVRIL
jgi:uncharacterized protein